MRAAGSPKRFAQVATCFPLPRVTFWKFTLYCFHILALLELADLLFIDLQVAFECNHIHGVVLAGAKRLHHGSVAISFPCTSAMLDPYLSRLITGPCVL